MNRIELLRYERGLTQEQVAEGAGISRATVIRLEAAADPRPTSAVAKALADFHAISVAELLGVGDERSAA